MEQEIKTIVKDEKFDNVVALLESKASKKAIEKQVIYNYHTEGDLRLIRTKDYAKLNFRTNLDENNVYIGKKYEKDLIEIFRKMGTSMDFKRFRIRHKYLYEDLYITIDKTIKTGNILRVKFNYKDAADKEAKTAKVNSLLEKLDIEITNLSKFEEVYGKYRTSWADLVGDMDEEEFLK